MKVINEILEKQEDPRDKLIELQQSLRRLDRGPGAPRKPTAYNNFVKETMPKVSEEHPDMCNREKLKIVAARWADMGEECKKEFM